MDKNIIINKKYDDSEFTNEIVEELPILFCKNTGFKISSLKVVFKNSKYFGIDKLITSYFERVDDYTVKKAGKKGAKETSEAILNDSKEFDVLNYKIVPRKERSTIESKICYVASVGFNNTVILKNNDIYSPDNIYFDLLATTFIMGDECVLDSDWQGGTEKIVLRLMDENFDKLFIKEIYLNIKLRFGDEHKNIEF
jgi:hypothetical protein